MATPPLTNQQALDYSGEHIGYEIEMLRWNADTLRQGGLSRTQGNALLESWVSHLRNLIEFLYEDAPRPRDVTAADFFPNPGAWQGIRTPISTTIKDARVRANKEISHLTTDRIAGAPTHKKWDTDQLTAEIVDELRLFQQAASPGRLNPSIKQFLT
jgi:hypothetical protein